MAETATTLASAAQPKSQASIVQRCEISSLNAGRLMALISPRINTTMHQKHPVILFQENKEVISKGGRTDCSESCNSDDMLGRELVDNVILPLKSDVEVASGSRCVSGVSDAALELFNADEPRPLRNRRQSLPRAEGVHQAIQARTRSGGRYLHMIPDVNQNQIKASTWLSKGDLKRQATSSADSAPSCSIPNPEQSKRFKVDETIDIMDISSEESDSELEKQPEVPQMLLSRWSRDDAL